jgi:hypothetical protein
VSEVKEKKEAKKGSEGGKGKKGRKSVRYVGTRILLLSGVISSELMDESGKFSCL